MKSLFLVLILITNILIFGCSEEKTEVPNTFVYGTWQLVGSFSHPPSGNGWSTIKDGFILELNSDGTFVSGEFKECQNGAYALLDNEISFHFDCQGFTAGYENPEGTFSYTYKLYDSTIELTPINYSCFEGCSLRFTKINNNEE